MFCYPIPGTARIEGGDAYIHPATHAAGNSGADLPPMGGRLRLRADYAVSNAHAPAQVILRAMRS
jgi:hypothetical protein